MSQWGPNNPHPLSQIKTELVWEGKYDEYGNRREVEVAGADLPLQKIEAIDEPRSHAAGKGEQQLLAFEKENTRLDDFRNMLIWGDNKLVMASLLKQFKGQIDLIYIDPPFDVGADFTMNLPVGDAKEILHKDQSVLEAVAYRDTWGKGTDSYLHMMYERLTLMHALLSEKGLICVHCDWRVVGKLKCLLEDVFGSDNHINEIIWVHQIMGGAHGTRLPKAHETILWFSKTQAFRINADSKQIRVPYSKYIRETMQQNSEGRWFYTRRRMSRKATKEELERKAHTVTYVDDPEHGTLASDDQRQLFLPVALTHNFCYRNSVVASLECYQKLEVYDGQQNQYGHKSRVGSSYGGSISQIIKNGKDTDSRSVHCCERISSQTCNPSYKRRN